MHGSSTHMHTHTHTLDAYSHSRPLADSLSLLGSTPMPLRLLRRELTRAEESETKVLQRCHPASSEEINAQHGSRMYAHWYTHIHTHTHTQMHTHILLDPSHILCHCWARYSQDQCLYGSLDVNYLRQRNLRRGHSQTLCHC